ncbi:Srl1p CYBJADRAFT_184332 [Cyberlindnera jadinii NRRL Y-1542]|uniref:Uncharacterized protein n=1 Tax=Cyberlindnera jadinii (strain ATCC 18201 / CBS 1600 / BCRC 20928 / JCM 3617 / NBRC 0987 / NRRL Y-1542) TaxID=983966 RepID=A0A1E4S321_CYBJN|nr:hypothetical protein CYBJADRAFT_184332 [Cyberlindnera jadinii NRRL Y-1542]ODV73909.1 hypothetical protein CYBJADRAFT_184332 [Cyberlindnera jadinii NRRL Y-1542]
MTLSPLTPRWSNSSSAEYATTFESTVESSTLESATTVASVVTTPAAVTSSSEGIASTSDSVDGTTTFGDVGTTTTTSTSEVFISPSDSSDSEASPSSNVSELSSDDLVSTDGIVKTVTSTVTNIDTTSISHDGVEPTKSSAANSSNGGEDGHSVIGTTDSSLIDDETQIETTSPAEEEFSTATTTVILVSVDTISTTSPTSPRSISGNSYEGITNTDATVTATGTTGTEGTNGDENNHHSTNDGEDTFTNVFCKVNGDCGVSYNTNPGTSITTISQPGTVGISIPTLTVTTEVTATNEHDTTNNNSGNVPKTPVELDTAAPQPNNGRSATVDQQETKSITSIPGQGQGAETGTSADVNNPANAVTQTIESRESTVTLAVEGSTSGTSLDQTESTVRESPSTTVTVSHTDSTSISEAENGNISSASAGTGSTTPQTTPAVSAIFEGRSGQISASIISIVCACFLAL